MSSEDGAPAAPEAPTAEGASAAAPAPSAAAERCTRCGLPLDSPDVCRHHTGSVKESKWSCCGVRWDQNRKHHMQHYRSTACAHSDKHVPRGIIQKVIDAVFN